MTPSGGGTTRTTSSTGRCSPALSGHWLGEGRIGRWETVAFVVGFGAVTAILWEIAEYFAFIRNSPELDTAYADTLGDLALGLTGSVAAGLVAALAPRRGQAVC